MNDIDKWCAEQCGVHIQDTFGVPSGWFIPPDILNVGDWTISDPRCREIVRDRFKIDTFTTVMGWQCLSWDDDYRRDSSGKTLAEAEIACITAIWEERDV